MNSTAVTSTSCIFCSLASAFDLLLQTFLGVGHNFGAEDDDISQMVAMMKLVKMMLYMNILQVLSREWKCNTLHGKHAFWLKAISFKPKCMLNALP